MKFSKPNFSIRTAIALLSVCAIAFWAYGQVRPRWSKYQQLLAVIDSSPENSYVQLDEVIVNLATKPQRYLSLDVALEVSHENELMVAQKVEHNRIALMDCLITHLSGKTVDDLRGTAAIENVRSELTQRFQDILFSDNSDDQQKVVFEKLMIQ